MFPAIRRNVAPGRSRGRDRLAKRLEPDDGWFALSLPTVVAPAISPTARRWSACDPKTTRAASTTQTGSSRPTPRKRRRGLPIASRFRSMPAPA